jgi:hypothetical protein
MYVEHIVVVRKTVGRTISIAEYLTTYQSAAHIRRTLCEIRDFIGCIHDIVFPVCGVQSLITHCLLMYHNSGLFFL